MKFDKYFIIGVVSMTAVAVATPWVLHRDTVFNFIVFIINIVASAIMFILLFVNARLRYIELQREKELSQEHQFQDFSEDNHNLDNNSEDK